MNKKERKFLIRIAILIGGDWSGDVFDGRDVKDWIDRVIEGNYEGLDKELTDMEESY